MADARASHTPTRTPPWSKSDWRFHSRIEPLAVSHMRDPTLSIVSTYLLFGFAIPVYVCALNCASVQKPTPLTPSSSSSKPLLRYHRTNRPAPSRVVRLFQHFAPRSTRHVLVSSFQDEYPTLRATDAVSHSVMPLIDRPQT